MSTNKNPSELQLALHSAHMHMVFDARNWAEDPTDAKLYALVVGWDDESYQSLKARHGWDDELISTLKRRHKAIEKAMGAFPECFVQR